MINNDKTPMSNGARWASVSVSLDNKICGDFIARTRSKKSGWVASDYPGPNFTDNKTALGVNPTCPVDMRSMFYWGSGRLRERFLRLYYFL